MIVYMETSKKNNRFNLKKEHWELLLFESSALHTDNFIPSKNNLRLNKIADIAHIFSNKKK